MIWQVSRGLDLNAALGTLGHLQRPGGGLDAHGKVGVRAADDAPASEHISSLRRSLRWRPQGQTLLVSGSVVGDDVCATDVPRESSRYRSVSACAMREAVPHGHSRWHRTQYAGERQCGSRLAHLCRLCAALDRDGTAPLCQRTSRCGSEGQCLRTGCDDDRSLFVAVSVGHRFVRRRLQ